MRCLKTKVSELLRKNEEWEEAFTSKVNQQTSPQRTHTMGFQNSMVWPFQTVELQSIPFAQSVSTTGENQCNRSRTERPESSSRGRKTKPTSTWSAGSEVLLLQLWQRRKLCTQVSGWTSTTICPGKRQPLGLEGSGFSDQAELKASILINLTSPLFWYHYK